MDTEGNDLPFLLKEFERFADELNKLPSSVETTALELQFALLRQAVEAKYRRKAIKVVNIDPN
ncbi:hypothetical protein [Rhizobium sp. Root1220]|uniref:hypothetical protein n=1 Tax=Rhizobium sp. Root1220 TaxID=1736432 RepID=UPI0006FEB697|nr:hypothetical protein [Rhizobium sp. Root1220]KQV83838.1 hypothetical protein ASC90_19455 [Rhizobium sp. Root1220]